MATLKFLDVAMMAKNKGDEQSMEWEGMGRSSPMVASVCMLHCSFQFMDNDLNVHGIHACSETVCHAPVILLPWSILYYKCPVQITETIIEFKSKTRMITHAHTCRPVDGTSMNEECVAVDAVG